jgi:hypothetical protein
MTAASQAFSVRFCKRILKKKGARHCARSYGKGIVFATQMAAYFAICSPIRSLDGRKSQHHYSAAAVHPKSSRAKILWPYLGTYKYRLGVYV